MDPMTLMAIANMGMQMMNKGQAQGQAPATQQQPQQKQYMPAPLPPVNQTDYGQVIKDMMAKQMPGQGMPMPGMGGL